MLHLVVILFYINICSSNMNMNVLLHFLLLLYLALLDLLISLILTINLTLTPLIHFINLSIIVQLLLKISRNGLLALLKEMVVL
jgi:hypothetical protein